MAMKLVETITVGAGGASSIEFTSIPQTGVDLLLVVSDRTNQTGSFVTINGSAITTFSSIYAQGNGSTASSGSQTTAFKVGGSTSYTADTFGSGQVYIFDYTSSDTKVLAMQGVSENNSTGSLIRMTHSSYTTSSPVTSLAVTNATFEQFSTASLYIIS